MRKHLSRHPISPNFSHIQAKLRVLTQFRNRASRRFDEEIMWKTWRRDMMSEIDRRHAYGGQNDVVAKPAVPMLPS